MDFASNLVQRAENSENCGFLRTMTSPQPKTLLGARTTPGITLVSFAAVLAFALPYFIYSKRQNEQKKKDRHMAELRGGAFNQMNSGTPAPQSRARRRNTERVGFRRAKSMGSQGAQVGSGIRGSTLHHFPPSSFPIECIPTNSHSIRFRSPQSRQFDRYNCRFVSLELVGITSAIDGCVGGEMRNSKLIAESLLGGSERYGAA